MANTRKFYILDKDTCNVLKDVTFKVQMSTLNCSVGLAPLGPDSSFFSSSEAAEDFIECFLEDYPGELDVSCFEEVIH